jgi:hypothetical protein
VIASRIAFACVALCATAGSNAASAIPLAPGGAVTPVGTTAALEPELVGLVVSDPLRRFVIEDDFGNVIVEGNLQDGVQVSDDLGSMIFGPRLRDTIGTGVIVGLVDRGFAGFTTDVEYRTDGLGDVRPDEISRSADGDALTFEYEPSVIEPPQEGFFLSVLTDAPGFGPIGTTTIFARDVQGNLHFVTLENTNAPIPEPSTVVLAGLGVAGLAAARSRRRRARAMQRGSRGAPRGSRCGRRVGD